MMETFHSLQIASNLQLEHQVLTELHQLLVKDGDFEKAEALIRKSAEFKFFEDFAASAPYKTVWKRINATDASKCDLIHDHSS